MQRALVVALALGLACAAGRGGGDRPLEGRVFDVRAGVFVAPEALTDAAARSDFGLLGERHDNARHHVLQARVIRAIAARHASGTVAFEMLDTGLRGTVAATRRAGGDLEALRRAVGWDESGWPDWSLYAPVFAAARDGGLVVWPANLSAAERSAVRERGPSGLDPAWVAAFDLAAPLPAALRDALLAEQREAHCDLLPEAVLPRMVAYQRAVDARLAASLLEAPVPGPVVLIAGSGHARPDRGVPALLRRARPDARVLAVRFAEVDPDRTSPAEFLGDAEGTGWDYLWFTAPAPRPDPCDTLREQLERAHGERGEP
jgi:uncharacterized iron-regulated protein